MTKPVIIASRGSKLALYQSNKVKEELEKHFPDKTFEIKIITTKGDKILDVALSKIGDRDLFTKELENALLQNEADLAVHSLKDIPTDLPEGLIIAGVLERADVRDALVSRNGKKLADLDEGDSVATSSLRRKAQLLHFNSKLRIIDIRGNVDSRIEKMNKGYCTAQIMAVAGLDRLGYTDRISEILDPVVMVPAVSQGAIAVETRGNDPEISSLISAINHLPTFITVNAERSFLRALEGGCQVPIGCFSELKGTRLKISGIVSNTDGTQVLRESVKGEISNAEKMALLLAKKFLDKGALELIRNIRSLNQK